MTRKDERKLNHFLISSPSGVILTTDWLEKQGISSKLAWWYVHSGLLERFGIKAYKKPGDNIAWTGAVVALQNQMHLPLHVGGKTALQILGRAHFIAMQGIRQVQLFAALNTKTPSWLGKQLLKAEFEIFRTSLFSNKDIMLGIIEKPVDGIMIQISCPERAAMELLYLYPKHESLEEIVLLIENLGQLRPAVVQMMLEKCNSIKVKRLFLYFSEKFQHPWLASLDLKKINLGKGKRVIASGGKYDSKYKVSLPEIAEKRMNFDTVYIKQVELLLDVLPVLNKFDCFALKGGTAINLFLRDMPRLSVDIDLAYLPIESRTVFLTNLTSQLTKMKQLIEDLNLVVKISYTKDQQLSKLFIHKEEAVIKIEPNFVIRGAVFECEEYDLCQRAQDQFLKFSRIKTLSLADLYGSKICAALDRQHPRDLFDVKLLFDNQGLTDDIRKALIVYLISSPRPIHELLNPKLNIDDFELVFKKQFIGMSNDISVSSQELIRVRYHLIQAILNGLTPNEKKFLMLFKQGAPDWSLIALPGIEKLPAVLWKLENIRKIPNNKKTIYQDNLKKILEL